MGNAMAASAPSAGPGGFGSLFAPPPPPTAESDSKGKSSTDSKSSSSASSSSGSTSTDFSASSSGPSGSPNNDDSNPGTYEDLHRRAKEVFPQMFEGGKLVINKPLSSHFQIAHTINLSNMQPPGYRFGATYVGENMVSPSEAYPVMFGDVDPSGNLNANVIHQFFPGCTSRFLAQYGDGKLLGYQVTNNMKGKNYTLSSTIGNVDLVGATGLCVLHYLQRVAPSIDVGAELMYQKAPQIPGGQIAVFSLGARYTSPNNFTISATGSPSSLHACYYQKGLDNVQYGVEVETNARLEESVASFGYQIDLPKADMVFRGTVDSNWTVGAVMEKRLQPLPFTFTLSGMLNHVKGASRFGIGLTIGQ